MLIGNIKFPFNLDPTSISVKDLSIPPNLVSKLEGATKLVPDATALVPTPLKSAIADLPKTVPWDCQISVLALPPIQTAICYL